MSGYEVLAEYTDKVEIRHKKLLEYAEHNLPLLDNILTINGRLDHTGHPELRMTSWAELAPLDYIPDPTNPDHVGHFARGFDIAGGEDTEQLQELARQFVDVPSLKSYPDHRARPAFYRALAILPGFTVNLVVGISSHERPLGTYGPETWLAYQIMSKLVDVKDPGALEPYGSPNRSYLFQRRIPMVSVEPVADRQIG